MNNIDRIFSERLEGHTSTPPTSAWEKVEMTISRRPELACPEVSRRVEGKRPAVSQWRWAAILIPVVVAGGWMLTRSEQSSYQEVANITAASPAPTLQAAVEQVKTTTEPVAVRRKSAQPMSAVTPSLVRVSETTASNPETAAMEEITIEPVELIAEVTEPSPAPAMEKPIVIVITLEAVAEVPDADKKPLERVADFAMAVKHSDPIASLRGVKDELLALDLRKKSTKKN